MMNESLSSRVPQIVRGGFLRIAPALLCVLFCLPYAHAQQNARAYEANNFAPEQTAAALKMLSPAAQTTIEELKQFTPAPIDGWRYHVGDVTGGQSPALDDASWDSAGATFRTPLHTVVWLRKWVEIPRSIGGYNLNGDTVTISIRVHAWGGEGALLFVNGELIQQINPSEPSLFHENPGDRVLVAIRIGKNATPTGFPVTEMTVNYSGKGPNPNDIYVQFVTAALMIPEVSSNVAADRAVLEKAIADVDCQALRQRDQQRFDRSLNQAQQDLESLRPILQRATFHLTGNSHIDSAWLWPWTETVDIVRRTFGTALQLMNEYPTYTYTQSAMQYNAWIAEKYPEMNEEIKKRIQEGRWEVVGGMWVEPDLNMPGGESQVRQLLIGERTLQQLYGVTTRVGWNPDSFGYNWQLPQIYKKSGLDYFVTQKMAFNETNPLPFKLFWWEAPDGSKVLAYFPHSYSNDNLSPIRLSNDLVMARTQSPGMTDMMDLYGVGDHGGGPTRAVLNQGLHWMEPGKVVPRMQFGTAQQYFSTVEKEIALASPVWNYRIMAAGHPPLPVPPPGEISIPTWKDELYFEHHRGTYTTQTNQKRNMRESEEWMLNAEKYSSLAWLEGRSYPATELNDAWKKVLFNQFHDLAAGSGIGIIYKDAQRDFDQAHWATNEISAKALSAIQARIDTRAAGAVPILVFNPLGWKRSGLVKITAEMPTPSADGVSVLDPSGRVLPSKILSNDPHTAIYHLLVQVNDVPSLGYVVLHVVPGRRPFPSDLKVSGLTLENSHLRVTIDSTSGCITSIFDKADHFEALAPSACGNQLQVFKDTPLTDDAWNIDPGTLDHYTPLMQADSVKLVESDPLRAVIRVMRTWDQSRFVQDIVLYDNSNQVQVINDIDWHETHILLKSAFPLAASSNMATYEIPYGTIQRPTTRNNSWEQAKFEVPALRWADLGDGQNGFSLLNNSKYGYDCKDNVLRLTLLRSPVSPDPNADRGHQHFSFAVYPHPGDWKQALTIRHGYDYNYQLLAMQVDLHTGALPLEHSFVSLNNQHVVLTAFKKAEGANALILRFYEWAGANGSVQIRVPPGASSASMTNLMEKPEGAPLPIVHGDEVTVPVRPYAINTLRFNYDPGQGVKGGPS
ncbi:MAG: alpha-mannosidase [Acidobacteriota bacterium]